MSDNPRLREWLDKYEEGEIQNPYSGKTKRSGTHIDRTYNYNFKHVGFWRRLFAYIIDSIIFMIVAAILQIDSYFLYFVIYTLYVSLFQVSALQGTIGKIAIGAIVTDDDGNNLDFTRSLARALSIYLSAFLLFIGFFMIAANSKKKGLHDMISGSLAINKK